MTNAIILNRDGRNLRNTLPPLDRVLLDAPCSGSGVASRDPSIKSKKTVSDFRDISNLQKELLLTAIDLVDANKAGIIVYSTCSVSLEENEMVVQHALKVLQRFFMKQIRSELLLFRGELLLNTIADLQIISIVNTIIYR